MPNANKVPLGCVIASAETQKRLLAVLLERGPAKAAVLLSSNRTALITIACGMPVRKGSLAAVKAALDEVERELLHQRPRELAEASEQAVALRQRLAQR